MPRQGPRKYDPLTAYLADLAADQVTLTFPEIEQLVGAPLPVSAWMRPWWTNTRMGSSQGRAWLDAGWRVAAVHRRAAPPTVTFVRTPPDSVE